MTKKELSKYKFICLEIDRDKQHLEELRTQATRITKEQTGMPAGSGGTDKLCEMVSKIVDLERLIQENLNRCLDEKRRLTQYIMGIEQCEMRILFGMRYIDGYSWQEIGRRLHCDRTTVWRKHNAFLKLAHIAHSKCGIV